MTLTMTKHIKLIVMVAVTILSFGSAYAAEEESQTTDADAESSAEEVVISQTDDPDSGAAERAASPEVVVPSEQICVDLSASFPVDI